MIRADALDELLALPAAERLMVAEAIWDSLTREPSKVPIPDWHREIVEQRVSEDDAEPETAESWAAFRRRIEPDR